MAHAKPLGWVGDGTEETIRSYIDVDGNNSVKDMLGVNVSVAHDLKNRYNIFTINDLVGYCMYNGFPHELPDETRFVVSLRLVQKLGFMPNPESAKPPLVHRTASDPLFPVRT